VEPNHPLVTVTGDAALEPGPKQFNFTNASACICMHLWLHFFLNGIDNKARSSRK
jgi:hypothetical protein